MIKDWTKYEAYRERLLNSIKPTFSSIDDDTFYDLFHNAYLEKYPVFEITFNATKINANEIGFLYKIVVNKINDLLNQQIVTVPLPPNVQIQDDDSKEIENETETEMNKRVVVDDNYFHIIDNVVDDLHLGFAEFLFNVVTQRGGLKDTDTENNKVANKHYKIVTPLIKMEAWASKAPLTDEILNKLSDKVTSDIESEQFYDWIEPTPIVRLKSWVGCS